MPASRRARGSGGPRLAGVGGRLGRSDLASDAHPLAADQGQVLPEVADLDADDDEGAVLFGLNARGGEER